jgi:hypothetical protein
MPPRHVSLTNADHHDPYRALKFGTMADSVNYFDLVN